jgi:16S rRNA (uracil1498-N3)-methyltransferase
MIIIKLNGFLTLEHLSNIDLYFTPRSLINEKQIIIKNEEFHHCVNVMRNSVGNKLYVTDGEGKIYESEINKIKEKELVARINRKYEFENKSKNVWFCIPSLKNPDRLNFAFEKCVELGITNFILLSSANTISKNLKPEKFHKTTLAAMKQSLRSFLPKINSATFKEIIQLPGTKILFEQNSEKVFDGKYDFNKPVYFIFGPEGGFAEDEIKEIDPMNKFNLASNRLRSETAVLKCASLLSI